MASGREDLVPRAHALQVMRAARKRGRIIWSPTTLLETLGIRCVPDYPAPLRRKAKKLLEALHAEGILTIRAALHTVSTRREVAYIFSDQPGRRTVDDKSRVYHPHRGRDVLTQ